MFSKTKKDLVELFKEYKCKNILSFLTEKKLQVLDFKKLNETQIGEIWVFFYKILNEQMTAIFDKWENSEKKNKKKCLLLFSLCSEVVQEYLTLDKIKDSQDLIDVMLLLQSLLNFPFINNAFKEKIYQISEKWCSSIFIFKSHIAHNMFIYLLSLVESSPNMLFKMYILILPLKSSEDHFTLVLHRKDRNGCHEKNIIKIFNFHTGLNLLNFQDEKTKDLQEKFRQIATNEKLLKIKEGQKFISFLFTVEINFSKFLWASIKTQLPEMSLTKAKAYGFIFCHAWLEAPTDISEYIQEYIIQNLMYHFLNTHRCGVKPTSLGTKILSILNYFHYYKNNLSVQTMITEMYAPLLWKNLKSINNICRANAIQLLGSAYPLELREAGRAANEELLNKQHGHLHELLLDPSPIVRILAIEAVGNILSQYWSNVSHKDTHLWLTIIIKNLVHDGSSWRIRSAVFQAFAKMVLDPLPAVYLMEVIPSLINCLHDKNENVRLSFINMITAMKSAGHVSFLDIIPPKHLMLRLKYESNKVGTLIANLIYDYYAGPDLSEEEFASRLGCLVRDDLSGTKNLFLYGASLMSIDTLHKYFTYLIYQVSNYAKTTKMPYPFPEKLGTEPIKFKQTKNKNKMKVSENMTENEINKEDPPQEIPSDLYKRTTVDNPIVAKGFLEIAHLLWTLNSDRLYNDKNSRKKLYSTVVSFFPNLLKFYKGHKLIVDVLSIASLVPYSIIEKTIDISVINICTDLIKSLPDTLVHESLDIVSILCNWKKASLIFKIATGWLTLKEQYSSLIEIKTLKSNKRRTRSIGEKPKPLLALALIDQLLSYIPNKMNVIEDNTVDLIRFMNVFEEIKKQMIQNIQDDPLKPPSQIFSHAWSHYIKFLQLLKDVEGFDPTKSYKELLEWCIEQLIPAVPNVLPLPPITSLPCCVILLQDVFEFTPIAISLDNENYEILLKLAFLCKTALSTVYGIFFVSGSCTLLKHFLETSQHIVIPSLSIIGLSFLTLVKNKFQPPDLDHYIPNYKKVRKDLGNSLSHICNGLGPFESHVLTIIEVVFRCCINPIFDRIQEDDDILKKDNIDELPFWTKYFLLMLKQNIIYADGFGATIVNQLLRNKKLRDKLWFLSTLSLVYTLAHEHCSIPVNRIKLACDVIKKIHPQVFPEKTEKEEDESTSAEDEIDEIYRDESEKMIVEIKRKFEITNI